jgi:DHA3 family macrolide efflux protein-like MFS transporter
MLALAGPCATGHLMVWHVYIAVGTSSLFNAFRTPAFAASIPLLARHDELPRVNGIAQSGNAAAEMIGPLLAGVMVTAMSLQAILLIDALSFLVSMAALIAANIPRSEAAAGHLREGLLREAVTGWRYVQERPGLVGLLAIHGSNNFVFSIARVVIAPLILSFSGPAGLGVQYAISGSGLLLGGIGVTLWGAPQKRIYGVLVFSLLAGICTAAHGIRPSFILIAVSGFLLFLMLPVIAASSSSIWQAKVPAGLQGRCFAIQRMTFYLSTVCGYFLAGPLARHVFEPMLQKGGLLSGSAGLIIGVGPERGLGLMFIALGIWMTLTAIIGFSAPAIRRIDEMRDMFSASLKVAVSATATQAEMAAGD